MNHFFWCITSSSNMCFEIMPVFKIALCTREGIIGRLSWTQFIKCCLHDRSPKIHLCTPKWDSYSWDYLYVRLNFRLPNDPFANKSPCISATILLPPSGNGQWHRTENRTRKRTRLGSRPTNMSLETLSVQVIRKENSKENSILPWFDWLLQVALLLATNNTQLLRLERLRQGLDVAATTTTDSLIAHCRAFHELAQQWNERVSDFAVYCRASAHMNVHELVSITKSRLSQNADLPSRQQHTGRGRTRIDRGRAAGGDRGRTGGSDGPNAGRRSRDKSGLRREFIVSRVQHAKSLPKSINHSFNQSVSHAELQRSKIAAILGHDWWLIDWFNVIAHKSNLKFAIPAAATAGRHQQEAAVRNERAQSEMCVMVAAQSPQNGH